MTWLFEKSGVELTRAELRHNGFNNFMTLISKFYSHDVVSKLEENGQKVPNFIFVKIVWNS